MNDDYVGTVPEWTKIAESDLAIAKHLFENLRPIPLEIICFHAQQSGEKMLKAFWVFKGLIPKKTHDLQVLLEKCIEFESGFSELLRASVNLTRYGVMPRYPTGYDLDEADAQIALKYADNIMEYVSGLISGGNQS